MNIKVLPLDNWMIRRPDTFISEYSDWIESGNKYFREIQYVYEGVLYVEFRHRDSGDWVCYSSKDTTNFFYTLAIIEMKDYNHIQMDAISKCVRLNLGPKEWKKLVWLYNQFGDRATLKRSRLGRCSLRKRVRTKIKEEVT